MLRWRLIFGTLIITGLALVCWLDAVVARPGAFLLPIAMMVGWGAIVELLEMFNKRGRQPLAWVLYSGTLLTIALAGISVVAPSAVANPHLGQFGCFGIGLAGSLLLACIGELRRYDGRWHTTVNLGLSAFAILYVGGLVGFIVLLRLVALDDPRWGMFALVSLIATVKMSDTGQYTIGRLFGRHKLAPTVSPGKTWEGAAGGLLFATFTAWFMFTWGARWMVGASTSAASPLAIVCFALAVGVAGIVGDLTESMLKREAGVKDSSEWLPGFGGILDLLDSLLFAAPVAYVFWALRFVGP